MAEKKNKKNIKVEEKEKKVGETPHEEGNLSDGVLDAFDNAEPAVELAEEEIFVGENEEEDELDSGDFRMKEEW